MKYLGCSHGNGWSFLCGEAHLLVEYKEKYFSKFLSRFHTFLLMSLMRADPALAGIGSRIINKYKIIIKREINLAEGERGPRGEQSHSKFAQNISVPYLLRLSCVCFDPHFNV